MSTRRALSTKLGAVAGEIVEGKRTFIKHNGHEFELPEQHTAELGELRGTQTISLDTPGSGGIYWVRGIDETDDRVIVHGDPEAAMAHGPGGSVADGAPIPEVVGYPFPS